MAASDHLGAQWWHGSPIGEVGKVAHYGIHVGTHEAAKQALESRIGAPAEGEWSGDRIYGKTLLRGSHDVDPTTGARDTSKDYYPQPATYHEPVRRPDGGWGNGPPISAENRVPGKVYNSRGATYSDQEPVPMDAVPEIFPLAITGRMTNTPYRDAPRGSRPHEDFKANGLMAGQLKRGRAKSGYYYENVAEDEGSISAVVPSPQHLQRLDAGKPKQMRLF